jgi:stage II sporulation protein D
LRSEVGQRNTQVIKDGINRSEPNLWLAFVGGLIIAVLAWIIVHGRSQGIQGLQEMERFQETKGLQEIKVVQSYGANGIVPQLPAEGLFVHNAPKSQVNATTKETSKVTSKAGVESADWRDEDLTVRVYLSESKEIETVPLEDYVRGVVAAEMPLEFEEAALEAQAMAARTYIIRRLWLSNSTRNTVPGASAGDRGKGEAAGAAGGAGGAGEAAEAAEVEEADVTDTQADQVYKSLVEMNRLKRDNLAGWRKIDEAVRRTVGEVMVYGDEPIEALYFSTSNGYTENSEEVFQTKLPYLRSVASPWDKMSSPRAEETIEMGLDDFYDKLGIKALPAGGALSKQSTLRVLEWTGGRRIKQVLVGKVKLTGVEVRHLLGLRSAAFDWKIHKDRITLTVYGSGHGVGMSQWGAQGMAKAGKTAQQIVGYYYSGVRLEKASKLVNRAGNRL